MKSKNQRFYNMERSYFFRMLDKVRAEGFMESDIILLPEDKLRKIDGLTAYNVFIILRLRKIFKDAIARINGGI